MKQQLESLILREARLLDQCQLDDWLALYTTDATYWVPIDEHADPLKESSVIYDDRTRMEIRVEQIMRQHRVAQQPASETLHMVSNIDIDQISTDTAHAYCAVLITELRSGDWRQRGMGQTRLFPGHCEYTFRRVGGDWRIASKKITLLQRKQPIVGLSFML